MEALETGLYTSTARCALERLQEVRLEIAGDYLELVERRAREFRDLGVSSADLNEVGSVALLRAIEAFDYRNGIDLEEHVTRWIETALRRAVRDASVALTTRPAGCRTQRPNRSRQSL